MKKALLSLIAMISLSLAPREILSASLVVKLPDGGASQALLLSPGTQAVLDLMRQRMDARMAAIRSIYGLEKLEKDAEEAKKEASRCEAAYRAAVDGLKKRVVSSIRIHIIDSDVSMSSGSSTGEIAFHYSATNTTDRIVSDVTYRPVIDGAIVQMAMPLVLEFINPANLVFGLGPGETLTNKDKEPEHLTFFLSDLSDTDKERLIKSPAKALTLAVDEVHFVSQKGFKGQFKVMDLTEAYRGQLEPFKAASDRARQWQMAASGELAREREQFNAAVKDVLTGFTRQADDLKRASVRATGTIDPTKKRASFSEVAPGEYMLYVAGPAGKACLQKVSVDKRKTKTAVKGCGKDPFMP